MMQNEQKTKAELFKELFDNMPVGVYRTTPDGRIIMANPAIIQMLGYLSFEELSKRDLEKGGYEPEYPRSAFKDLIEKEGKVAGLESAWIRHDGTTLFIIENARAVRDESGKTLYYEGIVQDITERKKAQDALRESEQKWRSLAENAPCVILTVNPDGTILFLNRTVPPFTPKKAVGTSIYEYVPPEHKDTLKDALERVVRTGEPYSYEIAGAGPDGCTSWYQSRLGPIKKDGRVVAMTLIATDVTDHKQAEIELRQSENKSRTLLENLPQKIFLKDASSVYLSCNENFAKDVKIKAKEIVGKTDYDFFPKELADKYRADDKEIIESGQTKDIEEKYIKDGQEVIVQTIKTPVKDEQGNAIGVLGIFWDITERKRTEQALQASENKYRELVEEMIDVIYTLDTKGNVTSVNKAGKTMLGREPEEVLGKSFTKLIQQEHLPDAMAAFKRILGGEQISAETVLLDKNGNPHNVEFSSTPIIKDGKVVGTRGIIRDITEHKKAEQDLQAKTAILQNIISNIPYYIFWKDENSIYLGCNDNFAKLAGLEKPEDVIGKTDYDLPWKKEESDFYRKIDKEVMSKGVPILNIEEPVHHGQGKVATTLTSKVPLRNADGEITGILGIFTDITERKRLEEALREEKDKAQKYLDIAGVMFLVVNANGIIELINRRGCEILGYSEDEIIGKNWFDTFIAQPIREETRAVFRKLMAGKVEPVEYYENPVITKSGEERLIAWHNTILKDEHGNIIGGLSSAEDITERKKAEERIRKLSTAVEQSIDGIAIGDLEPRLLYVNEAFAQMHGYTPEEMIGMPVTKLFSEEQMAEYKEALNQQENQGYWEGEVGHVRKNGVAFPVYASITLLRDDNGKPLGTLAVNRDITESKRREQELDDYRNKAARVERLTLFGTLSAALFHELTQPLTVINLLIENALTELETDPYSDTVAKKLRDMLTEVSRVNSVTHGFRDAVKRSSERIIKQVDLKAVAERTLQLFGRSARHAKVTLHLTDFDKLPPIYASEEELNQVFFALVDNAIQAACPTDEPVRRKPLEGGPLGRRADGKKERKLVISGSVKDQHIHLKFSDNCSGIAAEHLDKIFQPFFTTKPAGEATGLGLSVVEYIVSRAGGKVRVESKLGEGTTFYVTLPINIHAM